MTHDEILGLARDYAAARSKLLERTGTVREKQHAVVRQHLRGLRNAIASTAAAREVLEAAIESNPGLFERPRTRSIEGVKFGLRKQKGRVTVDNAETTIARLRKRIGSRAEAYIRTREDLVKDGLRELDAKTLAHCGVTVTDDTDAPTISVPRDNLDRLVSALLEGMEEEAE